MSVRTSAHVWAESQHSGTELLMLLAIADFADDDGNAYPAVATLAAKCRMKERNAHYILRTLEESGELQVGRNQGPKGANRYRITLPGVQSIAGVQSAAGVQAIAGVQPDEGVQGVAQEVQPAAGVQHSALGGAMHCAGPLQCIAPEPSLNHQEPESRSPRASRSPPPPAQPRSPDRQDPTLRGIRLPADWTLPEDWQAWAQRERPDLDLGRTADRFADFWRAKPGKDGRKLDWFATWRNWVRNERADRAAPLASTNRPPVLDADRHF